MVDPETVRIIGCSPFHDLVCSASTDLDGFLPQIVVQIYLKHAFITVGQICLLESTCQNLRVADVQFHLSVSMELVYTCIRLVNLYIHHAFIMWHLHLRHFMSSWVTRKSVLAVCGVEYLYSCCDNCCLVQTCQLHLLHAESN
jgi:hypothetical protein